MKQAGSIYDLYAKTTASLAKGEWPAFLNTAAWNFRFDFPGQLLIYAQRPDATACYSFDDWHRKFDRRIKKHAKGIALICDDTDPLSLNYVFDYTDTYSRKGAELSHWSMTPAKEPYVSKALHDRFFPNLPDARDLRSAAEHAIRSLLDEYWDTLLLDLEGLRADCRLQELGRETLPGAVHQLILNSCSTMVFHRCGYAPEQLLPFGTFDDVRYFDTTAALAALGNTVQAISKQVLREIALAVARYDHAREHTIREDTNDKRDSANLSADRGASDPRPVSARPGTPREVWSDAESISEGASPKSIHKFSSVRDADGSSASDRAGDSGPADTDPGSAIASEPGAGQNRKQLSLEHAHDSDPPAGRRTGASGNHLPLTAFTADDISAAIRYGSGLEGGKYRIAKAAEGPSDAFTGFLRKEYGTGGHFFRFPDGKRGYISHNYEGLHLHKPGCVDQTMSWQIVRDKILRLVKEDGYLTKEEHIQAERYWNMLESRQNRLILGESIHSLIRALEKDTAVLAPLEESIRAFVYENSEQARHELFSALSAYAEHPAINQNKDATAMVEGFLHELNNLSAATTTKHPSGAVDSSIHGESPSDEAKNDRGGEYPDSATKTQESFLPDLSVGDILFSQEGTPYRVLVSRHHFALLQSEKEEQSVLFLSADRSSILNASNLGSSKIDELYRKSAVSSRSASTIYTKPPVFNGSNVVQLYSIDKSAFSGSATVSLDPESIKSHQNDVKYPDFSTPIITGISHSLDSLSTSMLCACISSVFHANLSVIYDILSASNQLNAAKIEENLDVFQAFATNFDADPPAILSKPSLDTLDHAIHDLTNLAFLLKSSTDARASQIGAGLVNLFCALYRTDIRALSDFAQTSDSLHSDHLKALIPSAYDMLSPSVSLSSSLTIAPDDLLVLNDQEYEVVGIEDNEIFVHGPPGQKAPLRFTPDALSEALSQGIATIIPGWNSRNADKLYTDQEQVILRNLLYQLSDLHFKSDMPFQSNYFSGILDRIHELRISSERSENLKLLLYLTYAFQHSPLFAEQSDVDAAAIDSLLTQAQDMLGLVIDYSAYSTAFRCMEWRNGGEQALYQDLSNLCRAYYGDVLPVALLPLLEAPGQYTPYEAIPVLYNYLKDRKPPVFSSAISEQTYTSLLSAASYYKDERVFLHPNRNTEPLIDHPEVLPSDLSRMERADKVLLTDLLMFYSDYLACIQTHIPNLSENDRMAYDTACEAIASITVSESPAVNLSYIEKVATFFTNWFFPFSQALPDSFQDTLDNLLLRTEQLDKDKLLSQSDVLPAIQDMAPLNKTVLPSGDSQHGAPASDAVMYQENSGFDWERGKSDPIDNAGSIMLALSSGSDLLKAPYSDILDFFRLNTDTDARIRYLQEQVYSMGTYHEFGSKDNRMGFVGRDEYLYIWSGGTYTDHAAAHAYPWRDVIFLISEQLLEHDAFTPSLFDFSFEQEDHFDARSPSKQNGVLYDADSTEVSACIPASSEICNYSYALVNNRVYFRENAEMRAVSLNKPSEARVRSMIRLRDNVQRLIEAQLQAKDDQTISVLQKTLHDDYDAFTAKYGLINSRSNARAFSDDSSYYLLCSLEHVNDKGEFLGKADMFSKRVIQPATSVHSVCNAQDALFVSIGERGHVDLDFMSERSGISRQELLCQLKGQIFEDPAFHGHFQLAGLYLSGNIRKKLELARKAEAAAPGAWSDHIKALEKVQPKALPATDITACLGDSWIPKEVITQFIYDLFETPSWHRKKDHICAEYSPVTDTWNIRNKDWDKNNVRATTTFGTQRLSGYHLLENVLNGKETKVYDIINGKKLISQKETAAAQKQQLLICERFQAWVWSDPDRKDKLCRAYNDRLNMDVPPHIDGSFLRFHSISPLVSFTAKEKAAIAGMLFSGNAICDQTSSNAQATTMIAAAMESKALGFSKKPMLIVPNQLVGKWTSSVYDLYPAARVLAVNKKDLEPQNRKKLCTRIVHGDYDIIVIGQKQFEQLPFRSEQKVAALKTEIAKTSTALSEAKQDESLHFSIKQLERRKNDLQTALNEIQNVQKGDDDISFDDLGIDRLFVTEGLHSQKLYFNINPQTFSERAFDIFLKFRHTASHHVPSENTASPDMPKSSFGFHKTSGRSLDSLIVSAAARSSKPGNTLPKQLSYATN